MKREWVGLKNIEDVKMRTRDTKPNYTKTSNNKTQIHSISLFSFNFNRTGIRKWRFRLRMRKNTYNTLENEVDQGKCGLSVYTSVRGRKRRSSRLKATINCEIVSSASGQVFRFVIETKTYTMLWAKIYNIIHKKLQLEHMVHEWEPSPSTAKSHEQERTDWKERGER